MDKDIEKDFYINVNFWSIRIEYYLEYYCNNLE